MVRSIRASTMRLCRHPSLVKYPSQMARSLVKIQTQCPILCTHLSQSTLKRMKALQQTASWLSSIEALLLFRACLNFAKLAIPRAKMSGRVYACRQAYSNDTHTQVAASVHSSVHVVGMHAVLH